MHQLAWFLLLSTSKGFVFLPERSSSSSYLVKMLLAKQFHYSQGHVWMVTRCHPVEELVSKFKRFHPTFPKCGSTTCSVEPVFRSGELIFNELHLNSRRPFIELLSLIFSMFNDLLKGEIFANTCWTLLDYIKDDLSWCKNVKNLSEANKL